MNLILIDETELMDHLATIDGARARHVCEVLKLREGDCLRIGRVNGPLGTGQITQMEEGTVTLACTWAECPPEPPVDLLLALPRPKVMRRLWAQLAAIGVRRIFLTNAEKVERYYFDSHVLKPESVDAWLREGLQQARDTHLPQVEIHKRIKPLIEDRLKDYAVKLVGMPGTVDTIRSRHPRPQTLLALGPEGGWTDYEMQLFEANGFQTVGLGTRILRSDTACIAALSLVHDALAPKTQNPKPRTQNPKPKT